jgi:hypothetical protein
MAIDERQEIALRAYSISSRGQVTDREIQRELWGEAGENLEAEGFEYVGDVESSLHLPADLRDGTTSSKITAVLGVDDALVGISLYLGVKLADWTIEKVCDWLWEKEIRGPLTKMIDRRRAAGRSAVPQTVCFGVWYDIDGVYIGAVGKLDAHEDGSSLAELLPEAQRRGLDWVKAHGITHPVVIFPIRHGELATVPTLTDSIPE